jgi:uncharacterized cupin superfamily protein
MSDLDRVRLSDLPSDIWPLPERDIVAGSPNPRFAVASRSADQTVVTGVFRLSPGIFTTIQAGDEWTLVLKGRVVVTSEDGSRIECSPGDVMHLKDGAKTTYEVLEDYEDFFVITDPSGVDM